MSSNAQCLFCRIVAGEIPAKKLHESDDVIAFSDINPQAPTHILVIPRKHIPSLDDMTAADVAVIGTTILRATELARELHLEVDGYRVVVNNGPGAGQTVFHIHVHLLGGRQFGWPPG
jgi:histidine triad (HIT) family protein